jgi:hypothetical protein
VGGRPGYRVGVTGSRTTDDEAVAEAVAEQLDALLGPEPEPVPTVSSRTVQDDGSAERYEREWPARFASG